MLNNIANKIETYRTDSLLLIVPTLLSLPLLEWRNDVIIHS